MDIENMLPSIIEAFAVVTSAIIGAGFLGKKVNQTVKRYFGTYGDKAHNLNDIMQKAQKSIIIVALCGDQLLEKHKVDLERYMRKGIKIRYLLVNSEKYGEIDRFMTGHETADYKPLEYSLTELIDLEKRYSDNLKIRVVKYGLTASFVGIDLKKSFFRRTWPQNSAIHMMTYLFQTNAKNDPIMTFYPNDDTFDTVADSVLALWKRGKQTNLGNYLAQIEKELAKIN